METNHREAAIQHRQRERDTIQDTGGCQNYTIMWSFNNDLGKCARFWYGGCGGNGNRFKTKSDCEKLCVKMSQ
uniref:BPTI/Kunitz inhibitor domain-containing protein n=1 Tax=Dicentrarchus labrax TaxID=13489 RepID=A0A8C4HCG9_DICLA